MTLQVAAARSGVSSEDEESLELLLEAVDELLDVHLLSHSPLQARPPPLALGKPPVLVLREEVSPQESPKTHRSIDSQLTDGSSDSQVTVSSHGMARKRESYELPRQDSEQLFVYFQHYCSAKEATVKERLCAAALRKFMQDMHLFDDSKAVGPHQVEVLFAQYARNEKFLSFKSFCKLLTVIARRRCASFCALCGCVCI